MKNIIRLFKKWSYRLFEEDAAVHGRYQEALYWSKKTKEL